MRRHEGIKKIQKGCNSLSAIKEILSYVGIDTYKLMVIVHGMFMEGLS